MGIILSPALQVRLPGGDHAPPDSGRQVFSSRLFHFTFPALGKVSWEPAHPVALIGTPRPRLAYAKGGVCSAGARCVRSAAAGRPAPCLLPCCAAGGGGTLRPPAEDAPAFCACASVFARLLLVSEPRAT